MDNAPRRTYPSTPDSPLAQIIPLPVRKRKRAYRGRGSAFPRLSLSFWAHNFEANKAQKMRIDPCRGPRHKGLEYTLSGSERRILGVLMEQGCVRQREELQRLQRTDPGTESLRTPLSSQWIASAARMNISNANRILRRLGDCGIVVNLGGLRPLDLALNPDLLAWDMTKLGQLRKACGRDVSARTRNP